MCEHTVKPRDWLVGCWLVGLEKWCHEYCSGKRGARLDKKGKRSDTRSDGEGRMEKKEEVKTASVLMGGREAKSQGGRLSSFSTQVSRTHLYDDLFVPLRQQPWHKENASWGRIKQDRCSSCFFVWSSISDDFMRSQCGKSYQALLGECKKRQRKGEGMGKTWDQGKPC